MTEHKFDFLIIGSGLAGLYAADYASKYGKVAIITKSETNINNSYNAQGGIAVAIDKNDTPKGHYQDTLTAGRNLCNTKAVNILVNEGIERIKEIIDMGMPFDKINNQLSLGLEGGHHFKRIIHAGGDATGKELVNFLLSKIEDNQNIKIFDNTFVTELIIFNNNCFGAYAYDLKKGKSFQFLSKSTIIATGGATAIYNRSTNPEGSTGDGVALAYKAGAEIADMEFIQFHPTSFYSPTGDTFLISEAVRGDGAYLVNKKGERFMLGKHELAELAPRDIVSQTINEELKKSGETHVLLKLDHLDPEKIKKHFPTINEKCKQYGVDMTKEIPVAPAAHYTIGGIRTNTNAETNIKRLYACGEVASTGVMGANRLASNSLLECIVYGKRAVDSSLLNLNCNEEVEISKKQFHINNNKKTIIDKLKKQISDSITKNVGIERTENSISKFILLLKNVKKEFDFEKNEYYSIMLDNLITVCNLIAVPALYRKESRGAHMRKDFPEKNSKYHFHSIQEKNKKITFIPVK
ncbi:MAG: L-aspartate oxidase [Bacteroidales bacterium]|nr:L-aspartate oxidase [Bacteroidales bacterium]